jgi:predicted TIM-barrel enzyme
MSVRYTRLKRIAIANSRFLKSAAAPASSLATAKEAGRRRGRAALRKGGGLEEDGAAVPVIPRQDILAKFRDMVQRGTPIVGGGAGTGLSAKCEEAGGIDLIIIYNSGRYRMAGRGSAAGLLAYGNANEIVKEMAREVLPVVRHTPVLAGVNGTDPFMLLPQFLSELAGLGFSGVQNFPTVGLFDGIMRQSFEETGMGYGLEVDMIRQAHELDLLTTPYVFNPDEARAMTRAGADILVAHMGVTTGGSIGATSAKSLAECVKEIDAIAEAALAIRSDIIILCHGGPIAMPEDAEFVLKNCRACHGFYGASSMERLPVEAALTEQTKRFKGIRGRMTEDR